MPFGKYLKKVKIYVCIGNVILLVKKTLDFSFITTNILFAEIFYCKSTHTHMGVLKSSQLGQIPKF